MPVFASINSVRQAKKVLFKIVISLLISNYIKNCCHLQLEMHSCVILRLFSIKRIFKNKDMAQYYGPQNSSMKLPTLLRGLDETQGQFLSGVLTELNSEFSFYWSGYRAKTKDPVCPLIYPQLVGG